MRQWLSLLRLDMTRAVCSIRFCLTVLFIVAVMGISSYGYLDELSDVQSLLDGALFTSGSIIFIFCIAPILPYGTAVAADAEDSAHPFWVVRTGVIGYALSKFIAAVASGFLSVSVSIGLFSLVLSLAVPFSATGTTGNPYSTLLKAGMPGVYLLLLMVHFGLSGALFAGAAVAVSAHIPGKLNIIAIPVVVFWVLMRLTSLTPIPEFMKVGVIVQDITGATPAAAMLNKLIPSLLILTILLCVFLSRIRQRMLNS